MTLKYAEDSLVQVTYDAGSLLCSVTHPLMVRSGESLRERAASRLRPGDVLILETLADTRVTSVEPAGTGRVVMITTDGNHLYFAGDVPVLGHNIPASKLITASTIITTGEGSGTGNGPNN